MWCLVGCNWICEILPLLRVRARNFLGDLAVGEPAGSGFYCGALTVVLENCLYFKLIWNLLSGFETCAAADLTAQRRLLQTVAGCCGVIASRRNRAGGFQGEFSQKPRKSWEKWQENAVKMITIAKTGHFRRIFAIFSQNPENTWEKLQKNGPFFQNSVQQAVGAGFGAQPWPHGCPPDAKNGAATRLRLLKNLQLS